MALKRGPSVLVVEDEPLVRDYVGDILGQSGFAIIAAATGEEALKLVKSRKDVCAVVSDVAMPGSINGFELARRVRKSRPRVGVILVSGRTEPGGGELPNGVFFLSKPIRATTLLRLLRDVVHPSVLLPEPAHSPD